MVAQEVFGLHDRVAVVTGASSGIGRGAALALGRAGARVIVSYFQSNGEAAEGVVQAIRDAGGDATACAGDVRRRDDVQQIIHRAIDEYGRLDILVNAAGVARWKDVLDITDEDWDYQLDVNVKGMFIACQEAAREMVKQGGGRIINVTSITAQLADPLLVAYGASKGATEMLTRGLAASLAPYNVTVNAVAPGTTTTPMNEAVLQDPKRREMILARIPLGRFAAPDDIAGAIVFLASDAASYITGATLVVDGGVLIA